MIDKLYLRTDKLQFLQKNLDEVNMKLGDARVDKHEEARRKKKQEIVETFKSHFPGVVCALLP